MADWHEWVPEDKRGDMQKVIDRAVADRVKTEKAKQDALDAALKVREKELVTLRGEVDGYKGKLSEYEGQIRANRAQSLAQRLGLDPAHAGRAFELLESEHSKIFAEQKDGAPSFEDWAAGLSTDEGRAHEPSQFAARILVGFKAEPAAAPTPAPAPGQKAVTVQKPAAIVQAPNRNAGANVTPAIAPRVDPNKILAEIKDLRAQAAGRMSTEQRAALITKMQALQESLPKDA